MNRRKFLKVLAVAPGALVFLPSSTKHYPDMVYRSKGLKPNECYFNIINGYVYNYKDQDPVTGETLWKYCGRLENA